MISALDHPLVADYLRGLDSALADLPLAVAAELSEQIRAHLLEALPPDADDQAVTAALAALGPASVVAAAAAGPASGQPRAEAPQDPPLRRVLTSARRLPVTVWLSVAAITITVGVPSGALVYWQAQSSLQFWTTSAWWSRVDGAREVQTEAAGAMQFTVPIRPGKIQGFVITIYNPSDMTQVIMGSADFPSPGAPVVPQIAVSTTGTIQESGDPYLVSYRAVGPIPPHSYRWVRVLWRSSHCYLNAAGGTQGTSDLRLRVRVGWITRTEDVQLGAEFAVGASAASVHADAAYCRDHGSTP